MVFFLTVAALLPSVHAQPNPYNGYYIWNVDFSNNGISATSNDIPGRLYIPSNYNPANTYPMVIVYHGLGERGWTGTAQVNGNIDNLKANAESRGFFIYAPQIGTGAESWWDGFVDQTMMGAAAVMASYNIDRQRLYVTGLSMGGGGARTAVGRFPQITAAAVPVCGLPRDAAGYLPEFPYLVGKPIWQFHSIGDVTVPVAASRNYLNLIRAANNKPAQTFPLPSGAPYYTPASGHKFYDEDNFRYTEYSGSSHSIWGTVYGDANMYTWLLAQHLAEDPTLQPGETAAFDFGDTDYPAHLDSQGRYWNSITTGALINTYSAVAPFVKVSAERRSSVSLSVVSRFGGWFSPTSGLATTMFPDAVGKDGWVVVDNASETTNPGVLKVSGLAAGVPHRVEIYGGIADNDWGGGRYTRYQIGSEYRDLNAYNNSGTTAVFDAVVPDALGTFTLKVFNQPGSGSRRAVINTLTVTRSGSSAPVNQAPVVNAGTDQTTTLYDGIVLSGSATDDGLPTGSSLATSWSKYSGPGTVTFSNTAALSTTASFSAPGTYVLKLEASDSALTGSDLVTITVNEWKSLDIGAVTSAGSGIVTSGTAVITGSGTNIWKQDDQFQFTFRPITGDCTIIARQMSHPFQYWASKAGIMLRGSLGPDASLGYVGSSPGLADVLYMDHVQGQNYSNATHKGGTGPLWFKLQRVNNTVSAYMSANAGVTWEFVSSRTLTLGGTAYVGFAVCAGTTAAPLTVVFDNITVTSP